MSTKQNVNLATTTVITSTYAGEFAQGYIAPALLTARSIEQGVFTLMPSVKDKIVLTKAALGSVLKDASCDFDPSGTLTLTEKSLTLKYLHVNKQFCKSDFKSSFEAASMGFSAHHNMPKLLNDWILSQVAAQVAADLETQIYSGVSTNAGEINGIVTEIALDAALPADQEVAGTTTTVANIVAELQKIVDKIPNAWYAKENVAINCAPSMFKNYISALGGHYVAGATPFTGMGGAGTDNKGTQWYNQGSQLSFAGIPLVMCPGMAADKAICTYTDNLVYAFGVKSDESEVKIIDMSQIDGSDNVRIVMKMAAVASYKYAQDIVTYGITNGAN